MMSVIWAAQQLLISERDLPSIFLEKLLLNWWCWSKGLVQHFCDMVLSLKSVKVDSLAQSMSS